MLQYKTIKWDMICIGLLFLTACIHDAKNKMKGMNQAAMQQEVSYTCPMHHQIRSDKPGKCPICGMKLVPVEKVFSKKKDTGRLIVLSKREQFLANIHTDTARLGKISEPFILTGTTIFNPEKKETISARVSGWIDKLYVRNPGEKIKAGQKLYELYSPDLLAVEKGYLIAVQQKKLFEKVSVDLIKTIESLHRKLIRWGLTATQIDQLTKNKLTGKVMVYSNASGYLIKKLKTGGEHVEEGEAIMNLAKNKTIWVQVQLYSNELHLLANISQIKVKIAPFPDEILSGRIVFDNPVNQNNSFIHIVNIAIPNPTGKIQPGMLAEVYLQNTQEQPTIVIPQSAIVYSHEEKYVWVETGTGKFHRKKIISGTHDEKKASVRMGIAPGELVVISGTYLLNSAYKLKYGSGINLSGMQMSDMQITGQGN